MAIEDDRLCNGNAQRNPRNSHVVDPAPETVKFSVEVCKADGTTPSIHELDQHHVLGIIRDTLERRFVIEVVHTNENHLTAVDFRQLHSGADINDNSVTLRLQLDATTNTGVSYFRYVFFGRTQYHNGYMTLLVNEIASFLNKTFSEKIDSSEYFILCSHDQYQSY